MCRQAAPYALALLSTLAVAEPSERANECPKQAGAEVVVEALRFSDGRSYAYRVTNNGKKPIFNLSIGRGEDMFIEGSHSTEPVSIGSPSGWEGMHVNGQDPRRPGSHSPTLINYLWSALENKDAWIQPGRSLSGFSVQLPTPEEAELAYMRFWESIGMPATPVTDPPFAERLPPQPDLTDVPFSALLYGGGEVLGTIELDKGCHGGDGGG